MMMESWLMIFSKAFKKEINWQEEEMGRQR